MSPRASVVLACWNGGTLRHGDPACARAQLNDKAKVEVAVQMAQSWILALLRNSSPALALCWKVSASTKGWAFLSIAKRQSVTPRNWQSGQVRGTQQITWGWYSWVF